jgi:hypothetical protein
LRFEACDEGLLGISPDGAQAQGVEHPHADGAAARDEHAAVRSLPVEDAAQADAVPPIYQPEVAAEAVYYAAHNRRRRQVFVGAPTVYTIVGERVAPWLGDWYMAKTGVGSQQTKQPIDPPREGNLFAPVEADPGAHGDFDAKAHARSPVLWLAKHRAVGVAAGALAAAAAGLTAAVLR